MGDNHGAGHRFSRRRWNTGWRSALRFLLPLTTFFVTVAIAERASALDPRKAITQYVHAAWRSEDGLPQSTAWAFAQTPDGYLWIGTEGGLARFDGQRFVVFDKRNTNALGVSFVRSLFVDRAGDLWIGTWGGGAVRYRSGEFELEFKPNTPGSAIVQAIAEDREGSIWMATQGGVHRLGEGRVDSYTQANGIPHDHVGALLARSDGSLWAGTRGGAARFQAGRFSTQPTLDLPASGSVGPMVEARGGGLWVALGGAVVEIVDGRRTRQLTREAGLPADEVSAVLVDRDGSVWLGTGAGLARFRGDRIELFTTKDGLSNDTVTALFEDREGTVWVGTREGGINALKEARFFSFTTDEGLASNAVFPVTEDARGVLWIGTYAGLARIDDGKVILSTSEDGLAGDKVDSLFADPNGTLWVATNAGLHSGHDGRFSPVETPEGRMNPSHRVIFRDRSGVLWVGARRGRLLRFHQGRWDVVNLTASSGPVAMIQDRGGALWIATPGGGVHRLETDGRWSTMTVRDGLASDTANCLLEDREGNLWVGTVAGLSRFRQGQWKTVTWKQGLEDDDIGQVLEDAEGNLWLGATRGLFRVRRTDLEDVLDGRRKTVHPERFSAADGLESSEFNTWSSPSAWLTRDGRMAFGTTGGLVVLESGATGPGAPPPILIEELRVDDRVAYRHGSPPSNAATFSGHLIEIDPGRRNLEIQFATPTFVDPAHVTTRYRLEGFDAAWVEAGARRTAYYSNLPPGQYRFVVTACSARGACTERGAELGFRLLPFFHETRAFLAACSLAFATLIFGLFRLRTGQLRRRALEFERLVAQRTRELHESAEELRVANDRLQILASHDEVTGLANRRRFNDDLEREWRVAMRNGLPLSAVLVDIDAFKAYNDTYGHLAGDQCLKRVSAVLRASVRRPSDLPARYGGEEFAILLPDTPLEGARACAERARGAVEMQRILHQRSPTGGRVTISCGIATIVPKAELSPRDLLSAADAALYRAKASGRNRVVAGRVTPEAEASDDLMAPSSASVPTTASSSTPPGSANEA